MHPSESLTTTSHLSYVLIFFLNVDFFKEQKYKCNLDSLSLTVTLKKAVDFPFGISFVIFSVYYMGRISECLASSYYTRSVKDMHDSKIAYLLDVCWAYECIVDLTRRQSCFQD